MLYISTKFCDIISNGIKVMERTRVMSADGRTDPQKFGGYNIIPCHFFVAGHKTPTKLGLATSDWLLLTCGMSMRGIDPKPQL